jgi:hypothetical protein
VSGLVRCPGPGGTGCPDSALVRAGRLCSECEQRATGAPKKPKAAPHKRPRARVEALIDNANSEVVQAERAAWRKSRRR